MRRRLLAVLSVGAMVAALAAGVAPASGASAPAPRYRNLDPGGPARLSEKALCCTSKLRSAGSTWVKL